MSEAAREVGRLLQHLEPYEEGTPSRFVASPQEWDAYLRTVMTEDSRLRFYQWIGHRAVVEAVQEARRDLGNDPAPVENRYYSPSDVETFLDAIDPACGCGPYPSALPV